jgi:hypothetical protein
MQRHLPRRDLVIGVGRETTVTTTVDMEASGITTETSVAAEASVTAKAASVITEASTKTGVRLIVGTIMPLDVVGILRLELLEELGDLLLRLNQDLAEVFSNVVVAIVEEGCGLALVADTRRTADTMDILGDALVLSRGQIVVDDMLDIGNVETTRSNSSSDQDRTPSGTE